MISPVNSDRPINTSTDQSGRSHTSQKPAEASVQSTTQQSQATQANSAAVKVDQARRLFDIENNRVQVSENALNTPEEARSLLESIVQQISTTPATAAEAQAGKASADPISGILQSAPA
ncbi:MAG: hypothetical protein JAZ02_01425 [Candidatus Thiodiazotropha endolucinida]|nr:hypothetical protein [Candidatus Thiodiazotropha sp. (ex Lucina pensylvanica)]MCG8022636.1 hypothetical protein [Candidatus Thiodiazotropha endolucinida]